MGLGGGVTLPLTPARLAATYDFLRAFPPFRRWRLPTSDALTFTLLRTRREYGHYTRERRTTDHELAISCGKVGHASTLLVSMAHEMVHLKQAVAKTETQNTEHNAEFYELARLVCRRFGFDPKAF